MELDISKHGDNLEKEYSDFIRTNIPNYEEIWKRYIGNDGNNHLIKVVNLSPEEERDREFFSQFNYTALESFISIYETQCELREFKVDLNNKVKSLLKLFNSFILFWALIGRFNDNIKKIQDILNKINLISDLYDFYQARNQILHDRKIPYLIIDEEIMIPTVLTSTQTDQDWNEWKSWFDMNPDRYVTFSEALEKTYLALLKTYNSILSKILDRVKDICKDNSIALIPLDEELYKNNSDSSGSADWKAYYSKNQ